MNFFTKLTTEEKKRLQNNLTALILVCILYYLVTHFTGCPIRFFLGISCPGCGITRAWIRILHLDAAGAFTCHPLFWMAPLIAAAFVFEGFIDFKKYRWAVILIALLFLGVYLIRIIWFPDAIVSFQPSQGFLWKTASRLFSLF